VIGVPVSRVGALTLRGMTEFLLTEGDLDRGRSPDGGSASFRCGIVDPATGAVARSGRMKLTSITMASRLSMVVVATGDSLPGVGEQNGQW
jgi:hypothetical protein